MKRLFLLLISFVFAFGVRAQNSVKTKKAMYVNINIDIAYKDKDNVDLLDSNNITKECTLSLDKDGNEIKTPNIKRDVFLAKDITIFNIINGEKIKVNKPGRDYPNNHFIYKDEATGTYYLRIFLEAEVVLLQLNATTTDTIKCSIKKSKGNTHIDKVWYNGKLVWKFGKNTSQIITVVK